MLEKVLRVSVVRHWLYLAANPSQAGVDVDGLCCPLHCPTAYGCRPGVQSSWFTTVLPYFVAKPFLREPLPPTGPHAATDRLGPIALGLVPPCPNRPSWDGVRFTSSLSGGERPLRQFVLLWWRRFTSSGTLSE
jgi:hypothetical protein